MVWAGVVRVDDADATVLVATTAPAPTAGPGRAGGPRPPAAAATWSPVDGAWLTSEIELVD